jgi:hypothetical protein
VVTKYTFDTFKQALDFLEDQRDEGRQGIYYPEGGDNPRRMTTDTPRHIVLIETPKEQKCVNSLAS